MAVDVTVLGTAGSYSDAARGPCSSYLVQTDDACIWLDCGHGAYEQLDAFGASDTLDAIVISHQHPDHCVDLTNLWVRRKFGATASVVPVFAPEGVRGALDAFIPVDDGTFDWSIVEDGDEGAVGATALRFSRTEHSVETLAVEIADASGVRVIYTADTGPDWSPEAFGRPADLVLHEATFLHAHRPWNAHCSAREAGEAASASGAAQLMLVHRGPGIDAAAWAAEGSDAFGSPVLAARPGLRVAVGAAPR